MISPSVALEKLRSLIRTGVVGSRWHGFLYKFLQVSKVCILYLITYNLHLYFCNDFLVLSQFEYNGVIEVCELIFWRHSTFLFSHG